MHTVLSFQPENKTELNKLPSMSNMFYSKMNILTKCYVKIWKKPEAHHDLATAEVLVLGGAPEEPLDSNIEAVV